MPVPLLNFVSSADGAENIRSLVLATSILNKGEGRLGDWERRGDWERGRGGEEATRRRGDEETRRRAAGRLRRGSDLKFEIRASRVESVERGQT